MASEIIGYERLIRKLDKLQDLADAVEPVVAKYRDAVHQRARQYPPPPAKSRYIRTYKLRNSWRKSDVRRSAGNSRVIAYVHTDGSARTKYGRYDVYVMEARSQAEVHRNRWHTEKSMAEDFTPGFRRAVAREVEKVLNR